MKGGLKLPTEYLELMKSQAGRRRRKYNKGGLSLRPLKQTYHKVKDYVVHHAKKLAHNIKYKIFKNDKEAEVRHRPVHNLQDLKKVKEDLIKYGMIADPELKKVYEPRSNQPFEIIPINAPLLLGDGKRLTNIKKLSNELNRRTKKFTNNTLNNPQNNQSRKNQRKTRDAHVYINRINKDIIISTNIPPHFHATRVNKRQHLQKKAKNLQLYELI